MQTWVDFVVNVNSQNVVSRQVGSTAQINWVITPFDGMDHRGFTDNAYYVYVDHLFIDTTPMRVEIGNSPIYANCTERVISPATEWSTNRITITPNLGLWSVGEFVYIYIIDANNSVTAGPFEVEII